MFSRKAWMKPEALQARNWNDKPVSPVGMLVKYVG